jgi:hypothetical protein
VSAPGAPVLPTPVLNSGRDHGMNLAEAREHIGAWVVYTPAHGPREDGKILGVTGSYVYVLYWGDLGAKATPCRGSGTGMCCGTYQIGR